MRWTWLVVLSLLWVLSGGVLSGSVLGCSQAPPPVAPSSEPTTPASSPAPTAEPAPAPKKGKVGLGFLLLRSPGNPDLARLRASARELGLGKVTPGLNGTDKGAGPDDEVVAYRIGELDVMVTIIPAPHPDAPRMVRGLLSPSAEELEASRAHALVAVPQLQGDALRRDATLARVIAAVARATDASAAMLASSRMFYRADVFISVAREVEPTLPPVEVTVDLTVAPEDDGRVSILTHGLERYGREEFMVSHDKANVKDALDLILSLTRWVVADPNKQFPTGDTVGRTDAERITVQRVASPAGKGQVVRLDM